MGGASRVNPAGRANRGDDAKAPSVMTFDVRNKDLWSGAMLIASGAATMLIARNYPFGTALRMGPGYFPIVLGGILILFGLYLVASGLRSDEKIQGSWSLRGMVMLPLAFVLFGVLMTYAGFVPALLVLIFGSALASPQFKLVEVVLLSVLLTAASVALFVWGLGLPYPLIADF
jgi:putative tricarboxylic transport membrane protein